MWCVIVPIEPRSRTCWQPGRNPAGSVVASWFADTPDAPARRPLPTDGAAGHPRYDPIIKFGHYKVNQTKVPGRLAPMGRGDWEQEGSVEILRLARSRAPNSVKPDWLCFSHGGYRLALQPGEVKRDW